MLHLVLTLNRVASIPDLFRVVKIRMAPATWNYDGRCSVIFSVSREACTDEAHTPRPATITEHIIIMTRWRLQMRSIKNYVPRLAVLTMLAFSLVACGPGVGQSTPIAPTVTPAGPIATPTTEPMPVPTTQPTPEPTGTTGGTTIEGEAMVDSVEVLILESFPVQVKVNVKGSLADACTTVGDVTTTRDGNTFNVKITTTRPADAMCAQVITPFEENITLDVKGLQKGTYTVDVNGVTETFELAADNS